MFLVFKKAFTNLSSRQCSPRIWNQHRLLLPARILPSIQGIIVRKNNGCCDGSDDSAKSKHRLKFVPYEKPPKLNHDAKNMALNRPMSPHVTIYTPTVPSVTSIFQRITGIIVFTYAIMLALSLFMSNGIETYVSMIQSLDLSRPSIFLIKLLLGAPFAFHYFIGIRFCMWNMGKWLTMKEVYETAKKCLIATAIMSFIFALL